MELNLKSTVAVIFASLAIFSVALFHATLDASMSRYTAAVSRESSQQVVDIEVDQLAVSPDRSWLSSSVKIPQAIRLLENRRIRIRGYMQPLGEDDPTTMILNCEIMNESAAAYLSSDRNEVFMPFYIPVKVRNEFKGDFRRDPFVVEGTLNIEPHVKDGKFFNLFRIDDAILTPTKPREGFHRAIDLRC